ncbi:MAG TPA: hypothetical protein VEC17_00170 [Candidatus Binatia bacterium]|nr:hypothetical protein [Candidatus Binatia bacterium]
MSWEKRELRDGEGKLPEDGWREMYVSYNSDRTRRYTVMEGREPKNNKPMVSLEVLALPEDPTQMRSKLCVRAIHDWEHVGEIRITEGSDPSHLKWILDYPRNLPGYLVRVLQVLLDTYTGKQAGDRPSSPPATVYQ